MKKLKRDSMRVSKQKRIISAVDFGICALKVSWSDNRNYSKPIEVNWSRSKSIEADRNRSKPIEDLHFFEALIDFDRFDNHFDWLRLIWPITSIDFDRLQLLRSVRSVRLTSPGVQDDLNRTGSMIEPIERNQTRSNDWNLIAERNRISIYQGMSIKPIKAIEAIEVDRSQSKLQKNVNLQSASIGFDRLRLTSIGFD